jgi:hypothetical protein
MIVTSGMIQFIGIFLTKIVSFLIMLLGSIHPDSGIEAKRFKRGLIFGSIRTTIFKIKLIRTNNIAFPH